MLRTNSKQARANVRAYIMTDSDYLEERLSDDLRKENFMQGDSLTEEEACRVVWECFKSEYDVQISRLFAGQTKGSLQNLFTEWASGLACGGLFDYYYNVSAVQVLGDILEETEEERSKYTEAQAEKMLTYLIYREVSR